VAQSIEPGLPVEESYYQKGQSYLRAQLEMLSERLQGANFNRIVLQEWRFFSEMQP
jgi:hypothetical protein